MDALAPTATVATKPLSIAIQAMGGQGGGVLADWIIAVAEGQGWAAQTTSVPGVAQRTGATIYYLEMLPARDGTLQVVFRDAAGELRHVPPGRLPAHETAFASTVHKAQGNEHDAVVLVLPARASAVVGRALLYTAVTRARVRCTIASPADVLAEAIRSVSARHTGLQAQWAGLAAG